MWTILFTGLLALLKWLVTHFLGKVLLTLGIGYTTFSGLTEIFNIASTYVQSGLDGLGSGNNLLVQTINYLGIKEGVQLLLTAYTIKFSIKMINGQLKRLTYGR
jgi:hypothetical protein